jgi:hypothetical protein
MNCGCITADTSLTIPVPGGTAFQKGEETDKGSIADNSGTKADNSPVILLFPEESCQFGLIGLMGDRSLSG